MDGCVGRAEELKYLEDIYGRTPVACAVCGRRHLGKTTLLKSFCEDKPHIYLTGVSGLRSDNLAEINKTLSRYSGKDVLITDILDLLPTIKSICGRKKTVVMIDRYSDLISNFPEFNAYLRAFMNRDLMGTKLMLVVCDNDSSIFGRFFYTLDLKAMSYLECKGFHPEYSPLEHLMAYSIVGGTPAYQVLFRGKPEDVIKNQFFDHMSVFSLETEGLISSETATTQVCSKIVAAMARGCENIKDIATQTDTSISFCSKLLEDMEHKGLVQKEVSSGISRRAVYTINSNMIRFFYEVVNRFTHDVEFESPANAYAMAKSEIDAYMERGFKSICMDYVMCNYDYVFVGRIRRKDDTTDPVIDFVSAVNKDGVKRIMVARCRLYGDPFNSSDLAELMERARKIDGPNKLYALFSKAGFDPDLKAKAAADRSIVLRTLDDIYRG